MCFWPYGGSYVTIDLHGQKERADKLAGSATAFGTLIHTVYKGHNWHADEAVYRERELEGATWSMERLLEHGISHVSRE